GRRESPARRPTATPGLPGGGSGRWRIPPAPHKLWPPGRRPPAAAGPPGEAGSGRRRGRSSRPRTGTASPDRRSRWRICPPRGPAPPAAVRRSCPDAHPDPRRPGRVQPAQHPQQLPHGQGHAAGGGDTDVHVQEDAAARARGARGVVGDPRAVVVAGPAHRLRAAPGVGPPLVDPLVVERAGRVVVPEVVRVRLAVSEPDTGIGQNAEEEREPERSRRGAAVTLPLEPCGGGPGPAESGPPTS